MNFDGIYWRDVELSRSGGAWGTVQGADVTLDDGVTVSFATLNEDGTGWGVWGVDIDDHLYREPRDLMPEPLRPGRWLDLLNEAVEESGGVRTEAPPMERSES